MKKSWSSLVIIVWLCIGNTYAQGTSAAIGVSDTTKVAEQHALRKVIDVFFEALHTGDSTLMKQTIDSEQLKIQTTGTNRAGNSVLITQEVTDFLTAIASKKPTDKYEEKLLSYHYQIDGAMAHVWTPYEFYFNDDFSHCGVNSFQFFNDGKGWKIIYLIDTRRRNNCK